MFESRLTSLLRPDLAHLRAYTPHEGTFEVRLDANECPPLLSAEASDELANALKPDSFCRYPDARAVDLRNAIAAHCDADPDEIVVGAGSDEIIALVLTALACPRAGLPAPTIVTPGPTFVMYKHSGRARGYTTLEVALDANWDLDVEAMREAVRLVRPNVLFIASPNSPTSNQYSLDRLEAVIAAAPDALVIVDEAYVDFAPRTQIHLRKAFPNVAIMRTLSKIGFAALRVGWLLGPAGLVREIDKVRQPFNLPVSSQRGAAFVLRSLGAEVARIREVVIAERTRLSAALVKLGFGVVPSAGNFLWVECPGSADQVFRALAARGILVKHFPTGAGRISRHLRITVGLPAENDRLLAELGRCP